MIILETVTFFNKTKMCLASETYYVCCFFTQFAPTWALLLVEIWKVINTSVMRHTVIFVPVFHSLSFARWFQSFVCHLKVIDWWILNNFSYCRRIGINSCVDWITQQYLTFQNIVCVLNYEESATVPELRFDESIIKVLRSFIGIWFNASNEIGVLESHFWKWIRLKIKELLFIRHQNHYTFFQGSK